MTLYQRTDCPFCWKVRLALVELGLAYEIVEIGLGEKHPEVSRLSPAGTVPVLLDDGLAVWESAVIMEYLDSRYAPGRLFSSDPVEQTRIRLLHAYSDKLVGPCLRDLVFEKRSKPERDWDGETLRASEQKWRGCMEYLERLLDGRPGFSREYSAIDCALAARFGVAEAYGAGVTTGFPALFRWYRSMRDRPGWAAAYPTTFITSE